MSTLSLHEWIVCLTEAGATIPIEPPHLDDSWQRMGVLHIAPFATPQDRRRPGKYGVDGISDEARARDKDWSDLPPWGQIDAALWADIMPPIPYDWRAKEGHEPTRDDWCHWLADIAKDLGKLVWPIYKPGAWTKSSVGPILDADFELLAELRQNLGFPIASVGPTIVQHWDLFNEEDNRSIAFGTGYERYDPTLPTQVIQSLPKLMTIGIVDKVGSLDLQLKLIFQRPRAYQVAFLQARKGFDYQSAATANTPSLVSGHCLQASLGGCTAYITLSKQGNLSALSIQVLQQFTVDVGDRRVFAGVHYPSDNLASWFTALNLIPRVFKSAVAPEVKAFLWEAIKSRSVVFKAIEKHIAANPRSSPYREAVNAIKSIVGANSDWEPIPDEGDSPKPQHTPRIRSAKPKKKGSPRT